MKNKKVLTLAVLAGLTLGGLSVTAASAQSYGGGEPAASSEATDAAIATEASDEGGIVLVQTGDEADTTDAESDSTDADAETPGRTGRRGHRGGCNLDDAAEAIGISETDLKAAIESGDTIADVAEANGVDVDDVIASMVDAKAEKIDEKVSEGRVTQAEADEKLADLESRITDRVNGVEDEPQA